VLADYVVKHGRDSRLGEGWVRKTHNCLEATIKYTLLLFHVTELLILDLDGIFSLAYSHLIAVKVSRKLSGTE